MQYLADGPEVFPTPRLDEMSENAVKIFDARYVRKDPETNEPVETIRGTMWRVACAIAEAHPEDQQARAVRYYRLLTDMRMLPNSPTFTGAGTPLGNLSACFVLPIEDDMGAHSDGIFQTLRNAALIQKTGGGNGFSFSRLRPKGSPVHSSAGKASGPVSFLSAYDHAFSTINQGGARRGANMGVMRVDHPDIRHFIAAKSREGDIANFNISVAITDEFMRAVFDDLDFPLVDPSSGKVVRLENARELFHLIVAGAYNNGEPGALFIDTANRANPVPHLGDYEATNPCAEQWLLPYESCNLGCINLAEHVSHGLAGTFVDWELLELTIRTSIQFLDDVVEVNRYVPEVPKLREMALATRRIGLGIMGLADMMIMLGLRYGSQEGISFASQLMEFIRYHALDESVNLAELYGPFPTIVGSVYAPGDGSAWTPPVPIFDILHQEFGRPDLDWPLLTQRVRSSGVRNATQVTIAPTGTRATVADCEGYGCEPVFALAYVRNAVDVHSLSDEKVRLAYGSPLFDKAMRAHYQDGLVDEYLEAVAAIGSCQNLRDIPLDIRWVFVTSADITPSDHIIMQAVLQQWIDSSISKTINMPASSTIQDVETAYVLAWRSGCKGITVYVEGSREEVVLEIVKPDATEECTDEVCVICG